jgi:hypothetical protein
LNRRSAALASAIRRTQEARDAWRPGYDSLAVDQRRRLGIVAVLTLRELRNAVEQRRMETAGDEEDDSGFLNKAYEIPQTADLYGASF